MASAVTSAALTTPLFRGRRVHAGLRVAGDALLVVGCLAIGLTLLGADVNLSTGSAVRGDGLVGLDALLGLVCCPVLLARRRWPVAVALVTAAASVVSVSVFAAVIVSLFAVAQRRPWPTVLAVVGVELGAVTASGLLRPDPEAPLPLLVGASVLLLLPVVGWGKYVRARRELLASLRERAVRAEAEEELRAQRARALERARIAREMHDVLAHRISLVSMHAGALGFRPDAPPDDVAHAAEVIRSSAHEALEDLRDILGVLRAGSTSDSGPDHTAGTGAALGHPQPTLADLPALVDQARRAGSRIDLQVRLPPDPAVPVLVGRTAYRVVQEGLTNVRKHAPGHTVHVTVDSTSGRDLTVAVVDRAACVPPARGGPRAGGAPAPRVSDVPGAGLGLVGLAERVALAGGDLEHGPRDGGFHLSARLPWPV